MSSLYEIGTRVKAAADAIDAAIVAKGGSTTGGLLAAPDAIAALPVTPTERPVWDDSWDSTKMRVVIPKNGIKAVIMLGAGSEQKNFHVDWGDGSEQDQYVYVSTVTLSHQYAVSEDDYEVIVEISCDNINVGGPSRAIYRSLTISAEEFDSAAFFGCVSEIMSVDPKLTATDGSNESSFSYITRRVPTVAFPPNATSLKYWWLNSTGITGLIPEFPPNVTNFGSAFYNCTGLTGTIPQFPSRLKYMGYSFYGCTGLRGDVPPFPSTVTGLDYAFYNCSGITGLTSSPPDSCTNISNMLTGCISLRHLPDDYHANGVTNSGGWGNGGVNNPFWFRNLERLPTHPTFKFSTSFAKSAFVEKDSVAQFDAGGNIVGGFVHGINTCPNSGQTITLNNEVKGRFSADEVSKIETELTNKNWGVAWSD